MKRIIDHFLHNWRSSYLRTPLLVRGARQVGKTYSIREFGKTFSSFVELNFEQMPEARSLFASDFVAERILRTISAITQQQIIPGETLLFLDEIQAVPETLIALRYLYEEVPELHVIAAGSLLDFAIAKVGLPVGRVTSFYMTPLSFAEYLSAIGASITLEMVLTNKIEDLPEMIHTQTLRLVSEYLAIGGMPRMVAAWAREGNILNISVLAASLLDTYRDDFEKYGTRFQVPYLNKVFASIPHQLGNKFKFSLVEGDFRKRELLPCLDLLKTAGVARCVTRTAAQGIPVGAGAYLDDYKVILLDIALTQYMLDFDPGSWALDPLSIFVNKGPLVEAFVGQELKAYAHPMKQSQLYYWRRDVVGSEAEIDYVIQRREHIIPIEVKSGQGRTLRSMQQFLDSHPNTPYGMRFSTHTHSIYEKIHSYPLYALAQVCTQDDQEMRAALLRLI